MTVQHEPMRPSAEDFAEALALFGPHRTRAERKELGKAARKQAPRESHGAWEPDPHRPDPIDVLAQQAATRVPELVPIRHGRMMSSPFAFYRGAAAVMAADLAPTPTSGITVQACGDAHCVNFGTFATPERNLSFDVNDFDETLPGPWEWDVKRCAASLDIAGRENGFAAADRASIVQRFALTYRMAMREYASMRTMDVWYHRIDVDVAVSRLASEATKAQLRTTEKRIAKARRNDTLRAVSKMTEVVDGQRRIIDSPPLVEHIATDRGLEAVAAVMEEYRASLEPDRRELLSRFRVVDLARKVVGVGSVGTRAWILLMEGGGDDDPLFLQVKEAQASVLEPFVGASDADSHGERVVRGQRLTQAASDLFLGWAVDRDMGIHYYFRQLRDMKGSADVATMVPAGMLIYAELCGWALARGHAHGGDAAAISGYLGNKATFDLAMVEFARRYADQNERDHAALVAAVGEGRLEAVQGI